MFNLILTLALFALSFTFNAHAGYAQLKPPPGWSAKASTTAPATFKTGPAANDNVYKGSTVLTNATLNVGGQSIVVPASMRLAANAATIGATYAFGNPLLFAALTVGSAAYLHYSQTGYAPEDVQWTKADKECLNGLCFEYKYGTDDWFTSKSSACGARFALFKTNPYYKSYSVSNEQCVVVFQYESDPPVIDRYDYLSRKVPGTPTKTPVNEAEFHRTFDPITIPSVLPKLLPDVPWPYEQPAINPKPSTIPATDPSPSTRPEEQPMWVPTGNPVRNPNPGTNPDGSPKPDTYTQPGIRIKPAGTPEDPWRVDVTDEPKTKNDPSPNTDESVVTTVTPTIEKIEIETCGLPGKPKCLIDETGTKTEKGTSFESAKSELEISEAARKTAIAEAANIASPTWNFRFQLPTGCTPFQTGIKAVILDVCKWQPIIHDLMSMVWASATLFCLVGMFGRTIRES